MISSADGNIIAAATTAVATATGAIVLGASTADVIILDGDIATTAALETAVEAGGSFQFTTGTGAALVSGTNDTYMVLYDDGANSYLASVLVGTGTATATTLTSGDTTATNLITFSGVTDCTDIVAADFAAIIA